jgi:hypothetical protein
VRLRIHRIRAAKAHVRRTRAAIERAMAEHEAARPGMN